METDRFKALLEKYLNGVASEEEIRYIDTWYDHYEQDFAADPFADESDLVKAQMKENIWAKISKPPVVKLFFKTYWKYAAVFAFLIPAFFLGRNIFKTDPATVQGTTSFQTFSADANYKKIMLPDHSEVYLSPHSSIRVSDAFGKEVNRNIFLEHGEAFFAVSKDPKHPFLVHNAGLYTRVLGTKFSVQAKANGFMEVRVSEGRVEVGDQKKAFTILTAGKKLHYNFSKAQWQVGEFATHKHNNWYEQVVNLDHADFAEVARQIKIVYGENIYSKLAIVKQYQYNLRIRSSRSLDKTLKIICSVHNNKYRRTRNGIEIY